MDHSQCIPSLDDGTRNYDIRLRKFLTAVAENDYEYVHKKLEKGAFHVDARDGDFVTPLLLASMFGYLDMVSFQKVF